MTVESRFVVIRQGVEVETFMDKKAADEYDRMLDMADNLAEMFEQAPVELSEPMREELSIYFAQRREDVLVALQAKKPKAVKAESKVNTPTSLEENKSPVKKVSTKKAKPAPEVKVDASDAA